MLSTTYSQEIPFLLYTYSQPFKTADGVIFR